MLEATALIPIIYLSPSVCKLALKCKCCCCLPGLRCGCTPGSGAGQAGARNQPPTAKIPLPKPYLRDLPTGKRENTLPRALYPSRNRRWQTSLLRAPGSSGCAPTPKLRRVCSPGAAAAPAPQPGAATSSPPAGGSCRGGAGTAAPFPRVRSPCQQACGR